MSKFTFRTAGAVLVTLGALLCLSFLGSVFGLAGPVLYFFWVPGDLLFKSLHVAGFYVPAYMLIIGILAMAGSLNTRFFALLTGGMVPAFCTGVSLHLMFQGQDGALLPSWLVGNMGIEGSVIISAALAVVSFLVIIQFPIFREFKLPFGSSQNPGGGSFPGTSSAAPAGHGTAAVQSGDAPSVREFSQAMAGKLDVPQLSRRPDVDNLEPVDPTKPLDDAAGLDPEDEAEAQAWQAKPGSGSGDGGKRRPMFYDPDMPEEELEVYFSKDGSISDYPPKGRHSWMTSLEGPEGEQEEDERPFVPRRPGSITSTGRADRIAAAPLPAQNAGGTAGAATAVLTAREDHPEIWHEAQAAAHTLVAEKEAPWSAKADGLSQDAQAPEYAQAQYRSPAPVQDDNAWDAQDVEDVDSDEDWQDTDDYMEEVHPDQVGHGAFGMEQASVYQGALEEGYEADDTAASLQDDALVETEEAYGTEESDEPDEMDSPVAPIPLAILPRQTIAQAPELASGPESSEKIDSRLLPPLSAASPARSGIRNYSIPIDGVLDEPKNHQYWVIDEATQRAASILKQTLEEFGIAADVTGIRKGPVITMFEILPAPGVKLAKIVNLADNIALRLAAQTVRIVAPIPGKHAVGIEIPNRDRAVVAFAELLRAEGFQSPKMEIPVALGKDITGEAQIVDLARTPHLLIAGSTGSGKSVCVNALICSILYRKSPAEVNLILIDPKIVELKFYNDIPHLLTPVITDPKKAFQALQWCLYEMERRYSLLDAMQVRDIKSYNKKIKTRNIATPHMPYLVVVIDEFADLMATSGKELEGTLARLAAMSRAVGIHLVLATQRPSTDVITGLIKANIPSRIAFMVASKIDSRIIIDSMGAEKLLGKGDMLFTSAWDPFPFRMQGAFLSEEEVERVVTHVKATGKPDYIDDEIFFEEEEEDDPDGEAYQDGDDPLMKEAIDIVVTAKKASASYLQRRLKIGYNRAARLVEQMEEMGIVGPAQGSKAREILRMFQ